mmetsp:Transcript_1004/g.4293  ORF Transcript_1004/g.4293 Transcript_1004/m.4293 type:complete len:84 (+) Transcript_1004:1134-1385(+)
MATRASARPSPPETRQTETAALEVSIPEDQPVRVALQLLGAVRVRNQHACTHLFMSGVPRSDDQGVKGRVCMKEFPHIGADDV